MDELITIATAGNTLAPALAVLQSMGYPVEPIPARDERTTCLLQATKPGVRLIAEDTLWLLGLAAIFEARGEDWYPSDVEIDALLRLGNLSE